MQQIIRLLWCVSRIHFREESTPPRAPCMMHSSNGALLILFFLVADIFLPSARGFLKRRENFVGYDDIHNSVSFPASQRFPAVQHVVLRCPSLPSFILPRPDGSHSGDGGRRGRTVASRKQPFSFLLSLTPFILK